MIPRALREQTVAVGRHIPPAPEALAAFLQRFEDAYRFDRLSRVQQPVAVAAAHHLTGDVDRSHARALTGYRERKGREVVSALLSAGLLVSDSDRSPVWIAFPVDVVERWFPRLYPAV